MKYKRKKIFYIFHGRFPSEKAASLFAAKSCEALADQGIELTLLVPRRIGRDIENPFAFYHIKNNFRIVFLSTVDLFPLHIFNRVAFLVSFFTFSLFSFFHLLFNANKKDIIYSNESLPLFLASFMFPNTLYEVHDFPEKKSVFYRPLFRRLRWVLATNKWKKEKLKDMFGVPDKKIIYEPNAVEISDFDIDITKEEARERLGIEKDVKVVVYTGHLYSWKGVDTLAEAARKLPDVSVFFVGGTDKDVAKFQKKYGKRENINIIGYRPHTEIPIWQKAADVLVLPNTAKEDISKLYTSPMKLFEYMASGPPIVASDIPSIAEILNERNSVLIESDNPQVLAGGIQLILNNKDVAARIAEHAFRDVQKYSWGGRAKRIINFLGR